jgi:glycosyltransferase involved in cell wall biosynthesis
VVSSRVGCHRDLIIEGETGMVFRHGEAASLARCLTRVIHDPCLCRRMGKAARRRVSVYSTEASADGIRQALGIVQP